MRFLIYIEFFSNLAQPQNSRSIRLEMAQGNVKTLLFENHEKNRVSSFCYLSTKSYGQQCHFCRISLIKITASKGSRDGLGTHQISIPSKTFGVGWKTYSEKSAPHWSQGWKKSQGRSGDKSRQITWKSSTNRCRGKWKLSFRPKEDIPNTNSLVLTFLVLYWWINELIP